MNQVFLSHHFLRSSFAELLVAHSCVLGKICAKYKILSLKVSPMPPMQDLIGRQIFTGAGPGVREISNSEAAAGAGVEKLSEPGSRPQFLVFQVF